MSADLEAKTRLTAEELVAAQIVAEAELRSFSNLLRHALREYMRKRIDLIPRDVRSGLGTGWDQDGR